MERVGLKEIHDFGSPPIGNLAPKSRIHRHHQRSPMEVCPDQEAKVATFLALSTLNEADSSKAARKSTCSFLIGGLCRRAFASTVASSIQNEAPRQYACVSLGHVVFCSTS